jgi:hypothetical protein
LLKQMHNTQARIPSWLKHVDVNRIAAYHKYRNRFLVKNNYILL